MPGKLIIAVRKLDIPEIRILSRHICLHIYRQVSKIWTVKSYDQHKEA